MGIAEVQKVRRFAWIAGFAAGVTVFAAILFVQRDRYWLHARWTDFRLTYETPTEGGAFVTRDGVLALNPLIEKRVEQRMNVGEMPLLSVGPGPFGWSRERRAEWMDRVISVRLERSEHPFVVRLSVFHSAPFAAEWIARGMSDEVIQFDSYWTMCDENSARQKELDRELRENGGKMTPDLMARYRALNWGGGLRLQHISKLDRISPKASAGRVIIWSRLAESAVFAAAIAASAGVIVGMLARRLSFRRKTLSP